MVRSVGFVALVAVLLSSCASITRGTTQAISVTTTPVAGASCTLANANGIWAVTTPGTVTVPKSIESLAVKCVKPGYEDAAATISPRMQPESIASIVFAGPVGIFVDAQTGAINRYPDSIAVPMTAAQAPGPK